MRVIAGEFKSRILKDPTSARTHPMSEKIRGALFNSIGDIAGLDVIDAYSGTGAVGIEALSRGARFVYAVERDSDAFEILKHNRDLVTDDERMSVHRANVSSWVKQQNDLSVDIVIADPPYNSVYPPTLEVCARALKKGGLYILSLPLAERFSHKSLLKLDEKKYGTAKLIFYRKK